MIIYVDLLFMINYVFDFSILLVVDLLLKRYKPIKRVFLGALIGEISMISIFISFNKFMFLFKLLLGLMMVIITFGYKDIKYTFYNLIYLYLTSIILGGMLYYLYEEFKINTDEPYYLFVLISGLIFLFVYYKLNTRFRNNYQNIYKVYIKYGDYEINSVGYLDSGNKLIGYNLEPVILVEKSYLVLNKLKLFPLYYEALNKKGIVYCFKPKKVLINNIEYKVIIGISNEPFNIEGCNILLNSRMEIL